MKNAFTNNSFLLNSMYGVFLNIRCFFSVFIVTFEEISNIALVFLLLFWTSKCRLGCTYMFHFRVEHTSDSVPSPIEIFHGILYPLDGRGIVI